MNTAKQVDQLVSEYKKSGLSKPEIVVKTANACIGDPYVYGARGEYCTPANRKARMNPKYPTIVTKCQVLSDKKATCSGCQWYPGGTVRCFDCRGFTYWLFKLVDITILGKGATSQYNDDSNWEAKGPISEMPKDKVCCVFRYDNNTKLYEHTLLYDGAGNYIHCSGEVKKVPIKKYNATHYAIPKGLYNGGESKVSEKATVCVPSGSTVNMRHLPNKSSSIITRIPAKTVVEVIDREPNWCKINYKGQSGYVMTQYLMFEDSVYKCVITGLTKEQCDQLHQQYPQAVITTE